MDNLYVITYNKNDADYDIVKRVDRNNLCMKMQLLATSREFNPQWEDVPGHIFITPNVFMDKARPVKDKKELAVFVGAKTKSPEFLNLFKE